MAQEVPQVAEDSQDAVAHVGEHGHQHGRLLKGLDQGPANEGAMVCRCMDLGDTPKKKPQKPINADLIRQQVKAISLAKKV